MKKKTFRTCVIICLGVFAVIAGGLLHRSNSFRPNITPIPESIERRVVSVERAYTDDRFPRKTLTTFEYDEDGKLVEKRWDNNVIVFQYDDKGHILKSCMNQESSTTFTYDGSGRLISTRAGIEPGHDELVGGVYTTTYQYNDRGDIVSAVQIEDTGNYCEESISNYHYKHSDLFRIDTSNGAWYKEHKNEVDWAEHEKTTAYIYYLDEAKRACEGYYRSTVNGKTCPDGSAVFLLDTAGTSITDVLDVTYEKGVRVERDQYGWITHITTPDYEETVTYSDVPTQ